MRRLSAPQPAVGFDLDGQTLQGQSHDTVASAMLACGETLFSRSIKYHRPRGAFCFSGACAQCLMRIDGVPNLPACQTPLSPGMRVERQNAFPSAKVDVFSITDWFFPKGLNHHELFAGVPLAEDVMAKVARQLAGLGKLPEKGAPPIGPLQVRRVPLAIIGGGSAGLSAALTLAKEKVPFVLFERTLRPGGRLRHDAPSPDDPPLPDRLGQVDWLQLESTALGIFEDGGERFFIVRTPTGLQQVFFGKALLALGGYPSMLTFENNDLPGVFAGAAVARLIRQFRLLPGERFALVGALEDCAPYAKLLGDHHATVVTPGGPPVRAHGVSHVTDVTVLQDGQERKVACDTIVVCAKNSPSFELAEQGGAQVRFNPATGTFAVVADEQGLAAQGLYVAGQQLGPVSAAEAVLSGRRAALAMGGSPS